MSLNKLADLFLLLLIAALLQLSLFYGLCYASPIQDSTTSLITPTTAEAAESANLTPQVLVLRFEGPIGPATSEYLTHGIKLANSGGRPPLTSDRKADLVVIVMDTPGGLVSSLRDINQSILNSKVPVACLVAPPGARAASAGTYMLYACHVAAMAEATTLGAATPVSIGPGSTPAPSPNKDSGSDPNSSSGSDAKSGEETNNSTPSPSAMEKKVLNDSIAYIRALAQLRGRNQEWAELAVKEAATLTANEALEMNVINIISPDAQTLVAQLDGWQVEIDNQQLTLALDNAELHEQRPDWRNQIIATITNPNVAYILMLIGIYGILLEFYSPGIGIAGITGAISLLIAMYAFQMLPISYAGLGLLLLGLALITIESFAPSFGLFGIGGIIAFAVGSLFLIDTEADHYALSLPLIAAVSVTVTLLSLLVLGTLWRNRKSPIVSGDGQIVGQTALVVNDFTPSIFNINAPDASAVGNGQLEYKGFVQLQGEVWAASSHANLKKAQQVTVVVRHDLSLEVELPPTSN
ncbi:NfeD family protein [Shewanella sp. 30m-9]